MVCGRSRTNGTVKELSGVDKESELVKEMMSKDQVFFEKTEDGAIDS